MTRGLLRTGGGGASPTSTAADGVTKVVDVNIKDALANERKIGDPDQYGVGVDESHPTVIDLSAGDAVIAANASSIYGVNINATLSAHDVSITDSGVEILVIPASAVAGSFFPFPGVQFYTNLVIEPDGAATGRIAVCAGDR